MRYGNYYSAATADDMVDISGGYTRSDSGGSRYSKDNNNNKNNNGNKKKIIIISSIAAAVVIALGVTGFCLMNFNKPAPVEETPKVFTFAENTSVSGVDISGKTLAEAKKLLESKKAGFITPVRFSVNIGDASETLNQDNFEYTYDIDKVLEAVKTEAESDTGDTSQPAKDYKVKATVTDKSIEKNVSEICKKYNKEPVNAYVSDFHPYSDNRFDFVEQKSGFAVDGEDLNKSLKTAFQHGDNYSSIDALTKTLDAEVTVDFLKNNLVKLSSYETYSTNTSNGTTNMRVSLEACNGSIIDPNETWSFNDCTGDSNQESLGYKSAAVISEGKITDGIGGGICQSSSTIYNAAIRANMEIVERYNHKWASSYVPTGLDATIDYPNLDLKLKNISGYQMFLECKLVDSTLYATFWGYQDPSYDEIKTKNELGSSGGSSYSVSAWRVYYKDGKVVSEEELPSSSYDLENGQIFYEADNDYRDEKKDVDDLVESQDAETSAESEPETEAPEATEEEVVETEAPQTRAVETEPSAAESEPERNTEQETDNNDSAVSGEQTTE